jgi:short subunit dehydrogenase-like uncharacterized protein
MARFDLVVFGATSFVGQILCRVLLEQYGANGPVKWAMAGRSHTKLEGVRASLGDAARGLTLLTADAADSAALSAMCEQTRVVISTVGPYALYGAALVEVCARLGTDYCDLTGEAPWIRKMIDANEAAAKASGARIVHCCGFDSLPSDLGVHFLQSHALKQFGAPLTLVKTRVKAMRGGASGGTIASMLNLVKEATQSPALRRELADPYSLCPTGPERAKVRQPSLNATGYDADFTAYTAPFVMAAINTRVVHRSNALSGHRYGAAFRYDEAMLMGRGVGGRVRSLGLTGGLGVVMGSLVVPQVRWALERFVLPKAGEGPSPEAQASGFFDFRYFGQTDDGKSLRAKVTGDRDPGYGSTAKMLAQAAVCLATDVEKSAGGFWTPATLLGDRLIERLVKSAGLTFELGS